MEIKAELLKPYTESEKISFIVEQNHKNGYTIEEADNALLALGYTGDEITEQERERINMLFLTGADVERGIYQAKGMDFEDIIEFVKDVPSIDVKALKIEFKANNFYRGNPYVGVIGNILGFTTKQLDKFFETKDYHYLTTCKLTINPVPAEATVVIDSEVVNEVTVPYGSVVDYVVSCDGYESKADVFEITKDEFLEVVLDENTTDTTDSDIQDELDTTPSKSDEINTDILE